MKKSIVLVILDGWGLGRPDNTNPVYLVNPPVFNYLKNNHPSGSLQASGIAVGLPWGEEGNSEVGHLTLGAGRVIYQHFPRIELAINDGSFFKNPALNQALAHAQKNHAAVNLVGLLSESNVHASFNLLQTLTSWFGKSAPVHLHLFADGKDSPPRSFLQLLHRLSLVGGRLASVAGRYYALDRDGHWERTRLVYEALLGRMPAADGYDISRFVSGQYEKDLADEHLEPTTINAQAAIQAGDAVVFFNFREDGIRQIAESFVNPDFNHFSTNLPPDILSVTITRYWEKPPGGNAIPVAFPPQTTKNTLGEVLAQNNKLQLRVAETEKYAHVTYFFNGLKEKVLKNEYRILVPSRNLARPEEAPEMMADEITNRVIQVINEGVMDFILVNYANADVIAHTGNFRAAIAAVKNLGETINRLLKAAAAQEATLVITADHGNIEKMIDYWTGRPETKHDSNPVPIYIAAKNLERKELNGVLSDVAPTILKLLKIPQPAEMTGQSLI